MYKPFYEIDSLLFCHLSIDTSTLGDVHPSFLRDVYPVKAHLGVNAEDILSEIQEIEDQIERRDGINPETRILTTTLTEYENLVVVLTYLGFVECSNDVYKNLKLKRERYAGLANELIYFRDHKFRDIK